MLISLKEHFPIYWRMYPLMFVRECDLSRVLPLLNLCQLCNSLTTIFWIYVPVMGIWWSGLHIHLLWTNLILYYLDASKKITVMELRIATTWSATAVPNVKGQPRQLVHVSMTPFDVNVKYACEVKEQILSNSCEEIYRTEHKSTLHD